MAPDNIIISEQVNQVVVSGTSQPINVATIGIAGPPGATGPTGPAGPGSVTGTAVAGQTISADTLVVLVNNQLFEADPTNLAHANLIAGVATQSGLAGASIGFISAGQTVGGSWTQGSTYFAGLNGVLSTTSRAPGAVWMAKVAIAQTTTELLVNIGPVILI